VLIGKTRAIQRPRPEPRNMRCLRDWTGRLSARHSVLSDTMSSVGDTLTSAELVRLPSPEPFSRASNAAADTESLTPSGTSV